MNSPKRNMNTKGVVIPKKEEREQSTLLHILIVIVMAIVVTGLLLIMSASFEEIGTLFTKDPLRVWSLFAVALVIVFTIYVFAKSDEKLSHSTHKYMLLIYVSMLVTIGLVIIAYKFVDPFVAPITLLSIIVTVFIGRRMAILCNGLFSVLLLIEYMLVNGEKGIMLSPEILSGIVSMLIGYFVVFFLSKTSNRTRYLITGVGIALLSVPLSFASALLLGDGSLELTARLLTALRCAGYSFVGNILAVAIFLVALPVFESSFKVCTDFKLSEYCNFNVKLLRELSEYAPGTFNHSLMVGVLAESCALAIGENPQLARTCAYYHDVGKIKSPEFFAENQYLGENPHDDLIPEMSAKKITGHAIAGYEMLKKRGYPEELALVCLEHHGTMPVSYFYKKADKISDGNAELEKFSYAGPRPSSKISAIIMLCDACEAAARAGVHKRPLDDIVTGIFDERLNYGQFDECPITLSDLFKIKETIVSVLSGIHHNRVSYTPKI